MTSRTFKITYVVHITFSLDGASLGRIKSQKRHSVMLHTGLAVLFYEKCSVFKISLLNCPTQARPPRFITLHLKAHSSEEIAGLSFSSFFFPRLRDLGAQILSVQSFLRVISKIYLYQKSKYSLVQIFLMSMRVSFFKKIICLSALGLSCSKQDL